MDEPDDLVCRQVHAWHAYLPSPAVPLAPREDLERYEDLRSPAIEEDFMPLAKQYLVDFGDLQSLITLSPDHLRRFHRHSDGSVQYFVYRAVEHLLEYLETHEAATPIGSKPSSVPRTVLPKAVDPVAKNEAAEWAKLVRERKPAEALALAEKLRRKTS